MRLWALCYSAACGSAGFQPATEAFKQPSFREARIASRSAVALPRPDQLAADRTIYAAERTCRLPLYRIGGAKALFQGILLDWAPG
jgi:hypothetical protein